MNEQVEADFLADLKEFPKFLALGGAAHLHAVLTEYHSFSLLLGSLLITNKRGFIKGLGIYFLLWAYYRIK